MSRTKGARTRHKARGATQAGGGIVTVKQAFQRYWDDHGRFTLSTRRLQVAWDMVAPMLATELIGPNLYRKSAAYYQSRVSQGIAPATVRRELSVALTAPLKHCFKLGLISMPPLYVIKQKPNPRRRVLNDDEIRQLIEASKDWPFLFKAVILLAYTAQRLGAVLELEWQQVDMKERLINFNRTKDRMWERKKGRGVVPISEELHAHLDEWSREHTLWTKPLHPRVVGELPGSFYHYWRLMLKKAGLGPEVTPHIVRHSIATKLVREGKDIRLVQLLLGHKSLVTTETTYVKNDPQTIRVATDALTFKGKQ